ncbi:MAG TPA: type II restriction endonuclease [Brevundimonas sp.]|nr:type II restriction endonuclease [Brevundimonas sp.]
MKQGYLADYFSGVGTKRLSGTEVDPRVSNGHEFQGTRVLQAFLGLPSEPRSIPCTYMWLTDEEPPMRLDGSATWYDARANQPHRKAEPRLLYTAEAEPVVYQASENDTLFVCLGRTEKLLILLCRSGSDIEQQLVWLFGLGSPTAKFEQRDLRDQQGSRLDFAARQVLDAIEIEVDVADDIWLDRILSKFGPKFPGTAPFSAFTRAQVKDADPLTRPDHALMSWLDLEETLFFTLERHLIDQRLRAGFVEEEKTDVEGFISFSLSVQNRRKSRAGHSLEHHLASVFDAHGLHFERGGNTEGNKKPDFLFPSAAAYRDLSFDTDKLILLGAKSTCKDRWRQVLSEGARITNKHLVTLEPGISVNQTDEMRAANLQLVVPESIQDSYRLEQRDWLFTLGGFIEVVKRRAV